MKLLKMDIVKLLFTYFCFCLIAGCASSPPQAKRVNPLFADAPNVEVQPKPVDKEGDLLYASNNVDIRLNPTVDSPVYVSFEKSPTTEKSLKEYLVNAGFLLAESSEVANASVYLSGTLRLDGGPVFYRGGLSKDLGDVIEEAAKKSLDIKQSKEAFDSEALARGATSSAIAGNLVGMAFKASMFDFGLSSIASSVGSKMSEATFGDPRGICIPGLQKCEDWKKVKQKASVKVEILKKNTLNRIFNGYAYAFQDDLVIEMVVGRSINEVFYRLATPSNQAN